jgi:hypothetical protein
MDQVTSSPTPNVTGNWKKPWHSRAVPCMAYRVPVICPELETTADHLGVVLRKFRRLSIAPPPCSSVIFMITTDETRENAASTYHVESPKPKHRTLVFALLSYRSRPIQCCRFQRKRQLGPGCRRCRFHREMNEMIMKM